jgi:hypothetical protein
LLLLFFVRYFVVQVWGILGPLHSPVFSSHGIVSLDTLEKMCHLSLGGVEKHTICLFILFCLFVFFFFYKKIAMLLIEHELHSNCGLHFIGLFNILNTSSFGLIVSLDRCHMF